MDENKSVPMNESEKEVIEGETTRPGRSYLPGVDIYETKEGIWLWADMPGVDEKSLGIHVDRDVLTIEGNVSTQEYDSLRPVYAEYPVGNYRRRFTLSEDIDPEKIHARMNHGVLEVELPKSERAKPRRIEVAVG